MAIRLSNRDLEAISAYLDGQLNPRESAHLETRLQASAELRAALEQMRRTRTLLRSLPPVRAPRNFVLTPQMVGARKAPAPMYPVLRLASALATFLLAIVLIGDYLVPRLPAAPAMQASTAEAEVSALQAPAATEATAADAAAPAEEEVEGMAAESSPGGEATTEAPPAAALEMAIPSPTPEADRTPTPLPEEGQRAAAPLLGQPAPTPASPTPEEIQRAIVPPQEQPAPAGEQKAPAEQRQAAPEELPLPPAEIGGLDVLKVLEAALAVFALATGLAAVFLRR